MKRRSLLEMKRPTFQEGFSGEAHAPERSLAERLLDFFDGRLGANTREMAWRLAWAGVVLVAVVLISHFEGSAPWWASLMLAVFLGLLAMLGGKADRAEPRTPPRRRAEAREQPPQSPDPA